MARATLKLDEREIPIGENPVTFGRAAENTFPFPDNPNISRNHAEIAFRDGRFVVTDLGSSNGTTINGQPIDGETPLNNGDFITVGNSIVVEIVIDEETSEDGEDGEDGEDADSAASDVTSVVSPEEKKGGFPVALGLAGAAVGLAVVFVVVAGYVYLSADEKAACDATAQIISPANGDTISQETEVRINVRNSPCVSRVKVLLNDREIASVSDEPYTAELNPRNFPELSDGGLYGLSVVIEDLSGKQIPQGQTIALQFETREIKTPTPTVTPVGSQTPVIASGKQPTLIDVQKMSAAVVSKFTGANVRYNLANPEFLGEVRKRTAEYAASEGYFARAAIYKEMINQSFVRDKSLDASLPYLLAMSRSRFNLQNAGGEGLWQLTNDFAKDNSYNVVCTDTSLSEPTQDCASKVAALYLEELLVKTFDGDIILTVAAFGKSVQEANTWKASLPSERSDFWKSISDPAQREQVARFFAAAIVAENPQKFGLKTDRPISEHYPPVGK